MGAPMIPNGWGIGILVIGDTEIFLVLFKNSTNFGFIMDHILRSFKTQRQWSHHNACCTYTMVTTFEYVEREPDGEALEVVL